LHVAAAGHAGTQRQVLLIASQAWPAGQRRPVPQEAPTPQGLGIAAPHATASADGALAQVSVHTQAPAVQLCVAAHTVAQLPQWLRSVAVLTHVVPQSVRPAGHAQRPAAQVVPAGQRVPQAPQLLESVAVLTHAVLQ
jgi:hypothetical protein